MNFTFGIQKSKLLCLALCAFFLASCGSVPNLESSECDAARNTVREFYSIHFGNDMKPSKEYLEKREKFLTENWRFFVSKNLNNTFDYFTLTEDYPKAFRVGGCQVTAPDRTIFSVLLFWKDETKSEQKEIRVEAVRENDKWLINKVEN